MTSTRRETLSALLVASNRLVRVAAQATGNRTPSAIWRALGQLVEEELVSRIADTADSRAWLIRVTPKGIAALHAYRAEIGAALEPFFRDLDDADWRALERATELMAARTAVEKEAAS